MQLLLFKKKIFNILENRYLQLSSLYILSITIPLILKGPQLLVGTLVNFLLLIAISQFELKKIFPILFLPSVFAYLSLVLFGSATNFLLYLIPIITISNLIFVITFKKTENKTLNYFLPALLKSIFLFSLTFVLVKTIGLPQIFLTTMGVIQLVTALLGTILAKTTMKLTA